MTNEQPPRARRTRAQAAKDLEAGNPVSPLQELVPARKKAQKSKLQPRENPVAAPAEAVPALEAPLETALADRIEDPPVPEATSPPRILPVVSPARPHPSQAAPLFPNSCEVIVCVPRNAIQEFLDHMNARDWENGAPHLNAASMELVNNIIAQGVPSTIYKPTVPKRKHVEDEEEPDELLPSQKRARGLYNRAPARKPNRLRDIMIRDERKKYELERLERAALQEIRDQDSNKYADALAEFHVSSDEEDEPFNMPSPEAAPAPKQTQTSTITSSQTLIAPTTAGDATAVNSLQTHISQEVVTSPMHAANEAIMTPQATKRWGFGGLTHSVGRLFRFGNQPSIDSDAPVAPASAPHAPIQYALTEPSASLIENAAPIIENAPSESITSHQFVQAASNDKPGAPRYTEETFRKLVKEQRARDLKKFKEEKRRLEFEAKKRKQAMDQEIDEKVKAQLADKSKKRSHTSRSLGVIPNPPGASYGMNADYFDASSSDEDDKLPKTPSKRPSKRQRSESALIGPPRRERKLVGSSKSARPYTGSTFADPPPENIFDPTTHRRGGYLPKLDRDTRLKAEVWNTTSRLSNIPEAHRNYEGSFILPTSFDDSSSSDEERSASTTPTGSPSKSAAPDMGSSETPSGSWTQPPPRAPVPSPAALPKHVAHTPTSQPDLLAKAREQANRFAPSRPSGLRNASRVSLSTIASEGDREDDQADDVPAPTPETSKTAATFALLTEPARISPTERGATTSTASGTVSNSTALAARPDLDSSPTTRRDLSTLTTTSPGAASSTKNPLTIESLDRPSLTSSPVTRRIDPYDPKTYHNVMTAMDSLDPFLRSALKGFRDMGEIPAADFSDRSWAYLPPATSETPDVSAAIAALSKTGPIDAEVESALRALKSQDLAVASFSGLVPPSPSSSIFTSSVFSPKLNFGSQSFAAPRQPSTFGSTSAMGSAMQQAVKASWTERDKENASDWFADDLAKYKQAKRESLGA